MDSEEATFIICSIDSLTTENRLLRKRVDALEQSTQQTLLNARSSTSFSECTAIAATDECDEGVEPLTTQRLDEILRGIGISTLSWSDLRQLYPPRQSGFAPLHSSESMADDDEAYSQAATMAAYGMELLRVALGTPQINRRLTRQAHRLLGSLCATLVDTRDRHRSKETTKKAEDDSGIFLAKRSRPTERGNKLTRDASTGLDNDMLHHADTELTDLGSDLSWAEEQGQQQQRRPRKLSRRATSSTLVSPTTTVSSVLGLENDGDGGEASSSSETEVVVGQGQAKRLHRRFVIRNAFLSRGREEREIKEYFSQWMPGTNATYDNLWMQWVRWCEKTELDPLERSDESLAKYLEELQV
ncbi:hypothetical protein IWW38_002858, partial [Coemansia aciculifera]